MIFAGRHKAYVPDQRKYHSQGKEINGRLRRLNNIRRSTPAWRRVCDVNQYFPLFSAATQFNA
jgi:hypothetical protein